MRHEFEDGGWVGLMGSLDYISARALLWRFTEARLLLMYKSCASREPP